MAKKLKARGADVEARAAGVRRSKITAEPWEKS
jgi:hypothetical protein